MADNEIVAIFFNMADRNCKSKWLSIIGIGEDGLEGLSSVGRSLLSLASVIVGGERHLAMLPPEDQRQKLLWTSPIQDSINEIIRRRGQSVCVLASGDPMCYGIGVTLTRQIPLEEMTIIPSPSAFSLACSRLGWSLSEVETLSLCGRPPAWLNGVLYPGAKLLVLSADAQTPAIAARLLREGGFGESSITVLEHLGGTLERHIQGIANDWQFTDLADLNVIAISCI
ncbi:MAG: precorrin-6y C5,15-methyltransferase (decarboxylating) subunit CbiE, partial [Microcystis sp.]|uniref:precorrin-6y C5,15-methyltransferase (decarboxylating) subunit CbiE n=1 Tax=Microcystis sp. TaxID=1127 RepID=UPI00391F9578